MKKWFIQALWAAGSLAAILIVHYCAEAWLANRLTLHYLLLMSCVAGIAWLNLRRLPRTALFTFLGGFALLLGVLVACWKLGEIEALGSVAGQSWFQGLYERLLLLLALVGVLASSLIPIFIHPSSEKAALPFSKWLLGGAILLLDFAVAMPNIRTEKIFYHLFREGGAGQVCVFVHPEGVTEHAIPLCVKYRNEEQAECDTMLYITRTLWMESEGGLYGYFEGNGPRALFSQHLLCWEAIKDLLKGNNKNSEEKIAD